MLSRRRSISRWQAWRFFVASLLRMTDGGLEEKRSEVHRTVKTPEAKHV